MRNQSFDEYLSDEEKVLCRITEKWATIRGIIIGSAIVACLWIILS